MGACGGGRAGRGAGPTAERLCRAPVPRHPRESPALRDQNLGAWRPRGQGHWNMPRTESVTRPPTGAPGRSHFAKGQLGPVSYDRMIK